MLNDSLVNLPASVTTRIIERLDLPSRSALAQTCRALHEAGREAGLVDLLQRSLRPGRISTDPFPTLYEQVQRGVEPHYRKAFNDRNLLRACAALPSGDGLLQAAARRRERAWTHIERSEPVARRDETYHGEKDAGGRPHGVGVAWSHDGYQYRSVYLGDWQHGERSGRGTQFFWILPPAQWGEARAHDLAVCTSRQGGWYEGEWTSDKYSGRGLLIRSDKVFYEGLWRDGKPVAVA